MAKRKTFTVVVIDDKQDTIRRIVQKIQNTHVLTGDDEVVVSTKEVHLRLLRKNLTELQETDTWDFDPAILADLENAAQSAPDLIVLDHFYAADEVAIYLKKKALTDQVQRSEFDGRVLSPHSLRIWFESIPDLDRATRSQISSNFFDASCPIYLHSYTPQGLESAGGTIKDKVQNAENAFPCAEVIGVDTRVELYNSTEFDWPNINSRYDKNFYAYQLAVLFVQIVEKEIYRRWLSESRFLRLRRTARAIGLVSAIGAAVAFVSGWVGSLAIALAMSGALALAAFVFFSTLVFMLAGGFFLTPIFEKTMGSLIRED